jgi:hypothetical protein
VPYFVEISGLVISGLIMKIGGFAIFRTGTPKKFADLRWGNEYKTHDKKFSTMYMSQAVI